MLIQHLGNYTATVYSTGLLADALSFAGYGADRPVLFAPYDLYQPVGPAALLPYYVWATGNQALAYTYHEIVDTAGVYSLTTQNVSITDNYLSVGYTYLTTYILNSSCYVHGHFSGLMNILGITGYEFVPPTMPNATWDNALVVSEALNTARIKLNTNPAFKATIGTNRFRRDLPFCFCVSGAVYNFEAAYDCNTTSQKLTYYNGENVQQITGIMNAATLPIVDPILGTQQIFFNCINSAKTQNAWLVTGAVGASPTYNLAKMAINTDAPTVLTLSDGTVFDLSILNFGGFSITNGLYVIIDPTTASLSPLHVSIVIIEPFRQQSIRYTLTSTDPVIIDQLFAFLFLSAFGYLGSVNVNSAGRVFLNPSAGNSFGLDILTMNLLVNFNLSGVAIKPGEPTPLGPCIPCCPCNYFTPFQQ